MLSGSINKRAQNLEDFFTLNELNDSLFRENARLLETIINYRINSESNNFQEFENAPVDSLRNYKLIPATVCDKTINLRNNFLTLEAGRRDGIKPGMGVISKEGAVGIVKTASDNFATVLMLINSQSRISAMIKSKEYHGNIIWASEDVREMKMVDVPKHANVSIGDTVVTSGYSISFPKFINLGIVKDLNIIGGSNNYDILVNLSYDLSKISKVYVVAFDKTEEKANLISQQNE